MEHNKSSSNSISVGVLVYCILIGCTFEAYDLAAKFSNIIWYCFCVELGEQESSSFHFCHNSIDNIVFSVNNSLSRQEVEGVKGKGVDYRGCWFDGEDHVVMP